MKSSETHGERSSLLAAFKPWKLEDAKARFSELVKCACKAPQRVTVHGRDAVMVVDAETFARMLPASSLPSLHDFLSDSPLARLDFDNRSVKSPVRGVEL
jgi:prevent-host-death family protein